MSKTIASLLICILIISGATACGKSKAQKAKELQALQTQEAQQKIRDAVAAIIVRTKGSTYSEFRQTRLDFETCYEANKTHLGNIEDHVAYLSAIMVATDYCWNFTIKTYEVPIPLPPPKDKEATIYACILRPSLTNKLDYTWTQRENDKDFTPAGYVKLGLTKTQKACDLLLNYLNKSE